MVSDQDLIAQVLAGDQVAFEEIVRKFDKTVSIAIHRYCKPDEIEDLKQDIWLQVFRKLNKFRGESQLGTWIYRIARNQAFMRYRLSQGASARVLSQAISIDAPIHDTEGEAYIADIVQATDFDLDEELDREKRHKLLYECVNKLAPGYRTVLLLKLQGLEHHEIADIIDRTVGNSKSQWNKAKARLKKIMIEDAGWPRG